MNTLNHPVFMGGRNKSDHDGGYLGARPRRREPWAPA